VSSRSLWPRGLRVLVYWDRGFDFLSGQARLSLCFGAVLSCVGRGLGDGLIAHPRNPTACLNKDYGTSR
jgi:hypothetical protein